MAIIKVCEYCNKEYKAERKERKYCSVECKNAAKSARAKIEIKCDYCGKIFQRKKSRVNPNSNYCDILCLSKASENRITKLCDNCGEKVTKRASDFQRIDGKGEKKFTYCSINCMGEHYSKTGLFSGENSGTWLGGDIPDYGYNWQHQRKKALIRDKYICQGCGLTNDQSKEKFGQGLSVHHKIHFRDFNGNWKKANVLNNLISLCEPCHRKRHPSTKELESISR